MSVTFLSTVVDESNKVGQTRHKVSMNGEMIIKLTSIFMYARDMHECEHARIKTLALWITSS